MSSTSSQGNLQLWLEGKQSSPLESDSIKHVRESRAQTELMREYNASVSSLISQGREQNAALDSVAYGIENIRDAVGQMSFDVSAGIKALGALFDWRMQTVIALLEEQQRTRQEILKVLKYPRTTEAEEMKARARKSYFKALETATAQPEWRERYLADALRDFSVAAEKNDQDYTLHLDIGRILLLEHNQPAQALRYLDDAARHAHMESDEWEGKAFFLIARAREVMGKLEEAYAAMRRALELEPDNLVYAYELARYCVCTDRADECARHLERVLRVDAIGGVVSVDEAKVWWAKINTERDLDKARGEIGQMFDRLTNEAREAAEAELVKVMKTVMTAEKSAKLVEELIDIQDFRTELDVLYEKFEDIKEQLKIIRYFVCVDLISASRVSQEAAANTAKKLIISGQRKIIERKSSVQEKIKLIQDKANESRVKLKTALDIANRQTTDDPFTDKMNFLLGCMLLWPVVLLIWLVVAPWYFMASIVENEAKTKREADFQVELEQINKKLLADIEPLNKSLNFFEIESRVLEDALGKVQQGEYL